MENISIEPYKINARWYKFFIESDGTDLVLTTSDVEDAEIIGSYLVLPEGFHIMSMIFDFNSVESASATSRVIDIQLRADSRQAVFLPNEPNFDYGEFYILGHF